MSIDRDKFQVVMTAAGFTRDPDRDGLVYVKKVNDTYEVKEISFGLNDTNDKIYVYRYTLDKKTGVRVPEPFYIDEETMMILKELRG